MGFLRRRNKSSSAAQSSAPTLPSGISEEEVLTRESNTPPERLARDVGERLAAIQGHFPPGSTVVAEVMVPSRDGRQLMTEDIRPQDAPLLFARVRAGQGPCWRAFTTHQVASYQRPADEAPDAASARSTPTRLTSSRSALSIPLVWNETIVGVLNLESPLADTLSSQTAAALEQLGLLSALERDLAKIRLEPIADDEAAEFLIQRMRDRIANTIAPESQAETYYQILSVAASVVRPANVSAGLILVYNRKQELAAHGDDGARFAVRAARFGAFNSALEWELAQQSITRRIIASRVGEVILNAQDDPDYRDSGTRQERTGELIVPLIANGDDQATGVIGLVTIQDDNFDSGRDLGHMNTVAEIAVSAIRRSEEYKLGKRRSEQQRCADQLQVLLAPLFPSSMRQVTGDLIAQVRDRVSDQILSWVLSFTNAQHGAFVLLQTTPEPDGSSTEELIMTDKRTFGRINEQEFAPGKLPRWAPDKGYTGQALQQQRTLVITNVYTGAGEVEIAKPEAYIPYFLNAQSEVATPLHIGATMLGVLDVEADVVGHFTSDHVDWIEFLARQAAFALSVIERAAKTRVELVMADLSSKVDEAIKDMRAMTLASSGKDPIERVGIIQRARRDALGTIIETMRELTGAWVGRFIIELNAYRPDDTIDRGRGRLYYMASSDPRETSNQVDRFFAFGQGVTSDAFLAANRATANRGTANDGAAGRIVFNSEAKRPPTYFDSDPTRKSLSGIFQPVIEGTHVTGVLNLECEKEGAFSPELIRACVSAGDLISKLVTGSRLRIDTVLREMLRAFDFDIMRLQSSDVLAFMDLALRRAARLSVVTENEGWGTIVQLQPALSGAPRTIERQYWHDFTNPGSDIRTRQLEHSKVEYPIFREVIATQRPLVILDRMEQPTEERREEPWPPAARAIVAIPLLGPKPMDEQRGDLGNTYDVLGVLALAHPVPASYSEHDKSSLSLFAESIVDGFNTIGLLQSRASMMHQLRSNTAQATAPAILAADDTLDVLGDALMAAQQPGSVANVITHVNAARAKTEESALLVTLAQRITTWSLDLVDDDLSPDLPAGVQPAKSILDDFHGPADAFAAIYGKSIDWGNLNVPDVNIAGGEPTARLIAAVLAQYLNVAVSRTAVSKIAMHAGLRDARLKIGVRYDGPVVPADKRDQVFATGVTASSLTSEQTTITSNQQGLFQVKRLADRLSANRRPRWHVAYDVDQSELPNELSIEIPVG
jgi:putative methionine-R-sulfoxide reductase with GAF domain